MPHKLKCDIKLKLKTKRKKEKLPQYLMWEGQALRMGVNRRHDKVIPPPSECHTSYHYHAMHCNAMGTLCKIIPWNTVIESNRSKANKIMLVQVTTSSWRINLQNKFNLCNELRRFGTDGPTDEESVVYIYGEQQTLVRTFRTQKLAYSHISECNSCRCSCNYYGMKDKIRLSWC